MGTRMWSVKEAAQAARDVAYRLEELGEFGASVSPKIQELADTGPAELAQVWLDRQILLGLITPEGARAVEKLIEDLR